METANSGQSDGDYFEVWFNAFIAILLSRWLMNRKAFYDFYLKFN